MPNFHPNTIDYGLWPNFHPDTIDHGFWPNFHPDTIEHRLWPNFHLDTIDHGVWPNLHANTIDYCDPGGSSHCTEMRLFLNDCCVSMTARHLNGFGAHR